MKKLFGLSRPEEERRQDAKIKNITSCNLWVDFGTKKSVILKIAITQYGGPVFSKTPCWISLKLECKKLHLHI
jgi:hypothetical protein